MRRSCRRRRFNPRPARRPGAARAEARRAPEGSAFQSSPGPKAGRCRRRSVTRTSASSFNPRPARRPGAARSPRCRSPGRVSFQSSPGPKAGRCVEQRRDQGRRRAVSILARPEGRALHAGSCGLSDAVSELFQSSPGPKAGRCSSSWAASRSMGVGVSILARPEGRALPEQARFLRDHVHEVSILARPEGRALPRPRGAQMGTPRRFNPRPARRPGAASPGRRW